MNLAEAAVLAESQDEADVSESLRVALKFLDDDFDNPQALFLAGYVFLKSDKPGLAYQMFERASHLAPHIQTIWSNMGKCWHDKQNLEEAERCFRQALKVSPNYALALNNIGLINLNRSDYGLAIEYCNRALELDPDNEDAKINRAMAYLALGRWKEGWEGYNLNVGKLKDRKERQYGKETRWQGEKDKTVICYGEQGLGDEISFASCIPDLIKDSKKVIIECDRRVERLFARSFPQATVVGTRYDDVPGDGIRPERLDCRVAIGQLPQFYRNADADFPGRPYLVPDGAMSLQWKALLESLGDKPKIGISWTGGRNHTFRSRRSLSLESLLPVLKYPAHWISLQYQGADDVPAFEDRHGIKIHHWPWGVESYDYDQTVALISQLDLVISVTTTAVHVAGGLGKECWCLVPEKVMWRYLTKGSWFPWASSVTLHRQHGKEWPVYELANKLKEKFG